MELFISQSKSGLITRWHASFYHAIYCALHLACAGLCSGSTRRPNSRILPNAADYCQSTDKWTFLWLMRRQARVIRTVTAINGIAIKTSRAAWVSMTQCELIGGHRENRELRIPHRELASFLRRPINPRYPEYWSECTGRTVISVLYSQALSPFYTRIHVNTTPLFEHRNITRSA